MQHRRLNSDLYFILLTKTLHLLLLTIEIRYFVIDEAKNVT